jgi:hypothetical protein
MSVEIPESPRARRARLQKRFVRRLGMGLSALMVVLVLSVLFLIVRTEHAHDESACKFATYSRRDLGAAQVIEERRRCMPNLEERRYLVQRAGAQRFELARRRLDSARFASDRYKWSLREDAQQKLVLRIDVDGALLSESFEEDLR